MVDKSISSMKDYCWYFKLFKLCEIKSCNDTVGLVSKHETSTLRILSSFFFFSLLKMFLLKIVQQVVFVKILTSPGSVKVYHNLQDWSLNTFFFAILLNF